MASMKITELTAEQHAHMFVVRDRWLKIGLSTQPADRPEAERGIIEAYRIAGLAAPKIVWCGSPLSQGLTRANILAGDFAKLVGETVGDSVRASVGASVRDLVVASVWASVGDSVRASVGDSVWASVWASVRDSVGDSVGDSVVDSVYGQHDIDWLAFYEYFADQGLYGETKKLAGLWRVAKSAGWWLPHEKICWVSERHNILRRDDRGRLHCETGPALAYPDGLAVHAWHGIRVPAGWIEDRARLTSKVALTWQNIEQRRAACEILGWHTILRELDATTINKDADPEVGELVEVTIPDVGRERFLKVLCGTKREFALPVPPQMKTALEANAWTYGFDGKSFLKPEVRT